MNDRGDYRALFVSFADDVDVHALSGDAVKLLIMLKLSLPVTGIGVVYPSKLCDQVNCDRTHLEAIFSELETPKPGRDRGWIVRERNVVWVVNALAFETNLSAANLKKHVPFVRKLVAPLDSRSKIVSDFKETYPQWFQGDPIANGKGSDTLPDTLSKPIQSNSNTKQSINSGQRDLEQERGAPPAPPVAAAAPLADALAQLPKAALDFLRAFYARGTATTERRADVAQQLVATLHGGAEYRGQRVQAYSIERLARKCREVIDEGVRIPDKAIVVLLLKLGDTSDGAAPGVTAAAVQAIEQRRDERDTTEELERASAWLAEHPEIDASIDEQLERDGFLATLEAGDVRHLTRIIARNALLLTAWRHAGSPEVVHV